MILTICLLILVYTILGKDIKPLLEKIKNVDWKGGRLACEPLLKLWFVLDEGAAIFFVINKVKDVLDEWFGPEYSVSDAKA